MKLFYTRKEVDEEIGKAIYERERERDRDHRMDCITHDLIKLEERVSRLEMTHFNVAAPTTPFNVDAQTMNT